MRLWGTEVQTGKAVMYFKWNQKRNRCEWNLANSKSCHTHYFFWLTISNHRNKLKTNFVLDRFHFKLHHPHSFLSLNGCGIISIEIWLKQRSVRGLKQIVSEPGLHMLYIENMSLHKCSAIKQFTAYCSDCTSIPHQLISIHIQMIK